ncbi:FluC/FEX family fluoride channel [Radiobacillus sp. PE A8.2]|uniref:FluC/FEX family fluoride channel n=1 Tax=Radiobacillus sp. PE A8.2 TaxID=3380349 RepID=UPI0038904507
MSFLFVSAGGFLGAIARFMVGLKLNFKQPLRPYGTWLANLTGSLMLATLFVLYDKNVILYSIWLFLGVGFCGSYTTFSTFSNELLAMVLEHKYRDAVIYVTCSILLSMVGVFVILGLFL